MKSHLQNLVSFYCKPLHTIDSGFLKLKEKQKIAMYLSVIVIFSALIALIDAFRMQGGFQLFSFQVLSYVVVTLLFIVFSKWVGNLCEGKASFNELWVVTAAATLAMFPLFILMDLREALVFKGMILDDTKIVNIILAVLSIASGIITLLIYIKSVSHLQKFSLPKTLGYIIVTGCTYLVISNFIAQIIYLIVSKIWFLLYGMDV